MKPGSNTAMLMSAMLMSAKAQQVVLQSKYTLNLAECWDVVWSHARRDCVENATAAPNSESTVPARDTVSRWCNGRQLMTHLRYDSTHHVGDGVAHCCHNCWWPLIHKLLNQGWLHLLDILKQQLLLLSNLHVAVMMWYGWCAHQALPYSNMHQFGLPSRLRIMQVPRGTEHMLNNKLICAEPCMHQPTREKLSVVFASWPTSFTGTPSAALLAA
jgi:hypothetical protein